MKPLLVIGASSFGQLVRALVFDCGRDCAGFVDDLNTGAGILGTCADLSGRFQPSDFDLVMAIGYSHLFARLKIYTQLRSVGYSFPGLVHPRAIVSPHSRIGHGCIVMAGANIDAFTHVEPLCVLWPGAVVSHDSRIGANTFVSPNATLCGFVDVGESTFIGAGSVVVNGSHLPPQSFVKAGTRCNLLP